MFGTCECCAGAVCQVTGLCLQIKDYLEGFFGCEGLLCDDATGLNPIWDGSGMVQSPSEPCFYTFGPLYSESGSAGRNLCSGGSAALSRASIWIGAAPIGAPYLVASNISFSVKCVRGTGSEFVWYGTKSDGLLSPIGTYARLVGTSVLPETLEIEVCPP